MDLFKILFLHLFEMDSDLPKISSPEDISVLTVAQLNRLLKHHGLTVQGKKPYKVQRLCEFYNFSFEAGSFQFVLSRVRDTKSGWTKDIRRAPGIVLQQISQYLLKCHNTATHIQSEDIELFTPQNLRR